MLLEGSCHCQAVRFKVSSMHPYPFNLCYCSICRKTAGGGGFSINIGGEAKTLAIEGKQNVRVYQADIRDRATRELKRSRAQRSFCRLCGSALWVWDPRWPELLHPFASAIDTKLPIPPERTHLMLASKAPWVQVLKDTQDQEFPDYPDESIADWHERLGLIDKT
ncbi:MAG: GFA family protein [Acidiferrobacterales bacterium]